MHVHRSGRIRSAAAPMRLLRSNEDSTEGAPSKLGNMGVSSSGMCACVWAGFSCKDHVAGESTRVQAASDLLTC